LSDAIKEEPQNIRDQRWKNASEQRTHGILGQETDLDLRVKLVRTDILRVALRSSRTGCHTRRKQLQRESIPWKQQENRHENTQKMTKMTKAFDVHLFVIMKYKLYQCCSFF